jgi:hypothetical protein
VDNTKEVVPGRAYARTMASAWKRLRLQTAQQPAVLVLLVAGVCGLALSLLLIAVHMPLLGQFVAGLAVLPLTFAVYLWLLADTRFDGNGGGGWSPGDDGDPPSPRPGTPGDGVDWERFERELRAYAAQRTLVGSR